MIPKFSIVTLSFNQRSFLPWCVESVAAQGVDEVEHVIVDPGSSDGSRAWLEENRTDQMTFVFEPDAGPADGLNHGLRRSTGEIFMYLNADDELAPGALRKIAAAYDAAPGLDALIGDGWIIDEMGRPLKHERSDRFSPSRYGLAVGTVLQQSTSFKRAFLSEHDIWFNTQNPASWDAELHFDIWEAGARFGYLHSDLGYFRMQPDSITFSGRYADNIQIGQTRLLQRTPIGRIVGRLPMLNFPPRAAKKVINTTRDILHEPTFPGLARQG